MKVLDFFFVAFTGCKSPSSYIEDVPKEVMIALSAHEHKAKFRRTLQPRPVYKLPEGVVDPFEKKEESSSQGN